MGNKIKIIALFGESGAGKDTIQRWLTDNFDNMNKIISLTTREPRDYEVNGKDYYFTSQEHFLSAYMKNEILESSIFNNWYYGTPKSSLNPDKINIGVFNVEGIKSLLKHKELDVLPVWIQVDDKTRLMRCLEREADPNCYEICRRFIADAADFNSMNIDFDYEYYANLNNNQYTYYGFLRRPKVSNFIKGQN